MPEVRRKGCLTINQNDVVWVSRDVGEIVGRLVDYRDATIDRRHTMRSVLDLLATYVGIVAARRNSISWIHNNAIAVGVSFNDVEK